MACSISLTAVYIKQTKKPFKNKENEYE